MAELRQKTDSKSLWSRTYVLAAQRKREKFGKWTKRKDKQLKGISICIKLPCNGKFFPSLMLSNGATKRANDVCTFHASTPSTLFYSPYSSPFPLSLQELLTLRNRLSSPSLPFSSLSPSFSLSSSQHAASVTASLLLRPHCPFLSRLSCSRVEVKWTFSPSSSSSSSSSVPTAALKEREKADDSDERQTGQLGAF